MPFITNEAQWTALPGWLKELYEKLGVLSKEIGEEPYEKVAQYKGARLTPFNEKQKRAYELGSREGIYAPYFQRAQEGINLASKDFPEDYERYMNPYQKAVIDNISHYANRNFTENILPQVTSQFIGLGQHGSGRHQKLVEQLARDNQEAILRKQAEALASGYEHSGRMFNADQERRLHAAQTQADLGSKTQASHLQDVSALSTIGDIEHTQDQRQKELEYEEFLKQANYKRDTLTQLASVAHGIPYQGQSIGMVNMPQQQQPQVNMLGQIGSLAGNLLGARMAQGQARKRGGHIQKRYTLPPLRLKKHGLSSLRLAHR